MANDVRISVTLDDQLSSQITQTANVVKQNIDALTSKAKEYQAVVDSISSIKAKDRTPAQKEELANAKQLLSETNQQIKLEERRAELALARNAESAKYANSLKLQTAEFANLTVQAEKLASINSKNPALYASLQSNAQQTNLQALKDKYTQQYNPLVYADDRKVRAVQGANQLLTSGAITSTEHLTMLKGINDEYGKMLELQNKNGASLQQTIWRFSSYIAAAYMLKTAFDATFGKGIEYLAQMEQMQMGIAAVMSASSQDISSNGTNLTSLDKMNMSIKDADKAMIALKQANRETIATLPELTEAYQNALAPARSLGMTSQQTVSFTKDMANAAAAIGMPMNQLSQEIRAIFQGDTSKNSRVNQILQIKEDAIQAHAAAGDLYEFLTQKLKDYSAFGEKLSHTWKGLTSNIGDSLLAIAGNAADETFKQLKGDMESLDQYLWNNKDTIGKNIGQGIADIIKELENLKPIMQGIGDIASLVADHLELIVGAFAAKKIFDMATAAAEFAETLRTVDKATEEAALATAKFDGAVAALEKHPLIALALAGGILFFTVKWSMEQIKENSAKIDEERANYSQSDEYMIKTLQQYGAAYTEVYQKIADKQKAYDLIKNSSNPLIQQSASKLKQDLVILQAQLKDIEASAVGAAYKVNGGQDSLNAKPREQTDDEKKKAAERAAFEKQIDNEIYQAKIYLETDYTEKLKLEHTKRQGEIDVAYKEELAKAVGQKANISKVEEAYRLKTSAENKRYTDEIDKQTKDLTIKLNEYLGKSDPFAKINADAEQLKERFSGAANSAEALKKIDEQRDKLISKQNRKQEIEGAKQALDIQNMYVDQMLDGTGKIIAKEEIRHQKYLLDLEERKNADKLSADDYQKLVDQENKFYLRNTDTTYQEVKQMTQDLTGSMETSFSNFFDSTNAGFMKFGTLASDIINQVYREMIKMYIAAPITQAIMGGVQNLAGNGGLTQEQVLQGNTNETVVVAHGGISDGLTIQKFAGGYLAGGGYANYDSYSNDNIPAMISKGEAVIPASSVFANKELVQFLIKNRGAKLFADGYMAPNISSPQSGSSNIKIEIINQTGEDTKVTKTSSKNDMGELVVSVWIDKVSRNQNGSRDAARAALGLNG